MSSVHASVVQTKAPNIPLLANGDRLTQAEFHRRYQLIPDDVKAELIGGIVYMASPLRRAHGVSHPELSGAFWLYKAATPGVEVLDNATTILGEESEPQPDLALRILPECGGQSRTDGDDYVVGAPEVVAEIAHSSRAIDMHRKRDDYRDAGVREYLVVCLEEAELHWFDFSTEQRLRPNRDGVYKSIVFPGLWIDGRALLDRDSMKLIAVLQHGLNSREHRAFKKRLGAAIEPPRKGKNKS
ncbi:MAG: Uma2 family endonuclease [Gemmataceae bacterium]|nr:Uma2 family endonuclease [Gemmataceae bacterium]